MTTPQPLTRQERKEALAAYDREISACEERADKGDNVDHWRARVNDLQAQRAKALSELEGRSAGRDPWEST